MSPQRKEALVDITLGVIILIIFVIFVVFSYASIGEAEARDVDGRYAQSPLRDWFQSLRSGKGPCCADADGMNVKDVDWDTKDNHYRVRIDGEWVDVPDDSVIKTPNLAGRAIVWPIYGWNGEHRIITIRCFLPGIEG